MNSGEESTGESPGRTGVLRSARCSAPRDYVTS